MSAAKVVTCTAPRHSGDWRSLKSELHDALNIKLISEFPIFTAYEILISVQKSAYCVLIREKMLRGMKLTAVVAHAVLRAELADGVRDVLGLAASLREPRLQVRLAVLHHRLAPLRVPHPILQSETPIKICIA